MTNLVAKFLEGRQARSAYTPANALGRFVYSTGFELFIGFIILLNAISVALLTMPNTDGGLRSALEGFDAIAYRIYVVELLLRMVSYGRHPLRFFSKSWNVFDFLVIVSVPFFAGQTVVVRMLRLLRLIRIFRFLPEVRILVASIGKSLPPLLSMSFLISLLMFIFAMGGYYLFSAAIPEHWGDIATAMTTLFVLLTLEEFAVYLTEAIAVTPWALPYFAAYVFVLVFTVLNVLIGIVLYAMDQARSQEVGEPAEAKIEQRLAALEARLETENSPAS